MMDNWLILKQLNSNVLDYYAQLEEMKLRCAVREEQWVTMTRSLMDLELTLRERWASTILSNGGLPKSTRNRKVQNAFLFW